MYLKNLAGILPVEGTASPDLEVTGLSSDSRQVRPGVVFFALAGSKADGSTYAADAAGRGFAAASIGTTGVVAPGRNEYGSLTTPDPVALHELLKELTEAGVTHASMEASSHGLDQRRLDGVKLAAGGFT
ncbi:MAG: UDP-N-acetylmuramoyl-L-alanyl-D-glutamate--2,6-diaminopimelate ligase, partial [Mesorhizobium sp.]